MKTKTEEYNNYYRILMRKRNFFKNGWKYNLTKEEAFILLQKIETEDIFCLQNEIEELRR